MAYQETTRQSYGSKVKNSFQGILWGIILILAGTVVLWWNEGRAVKASDALKDFQKNYVELSDISKIDPEFEGKAVHATGVATTADTLRDGAFGIAVNAMKLARSVEYYQWTQHSKSEKKDKLGGSTETTTTYTYEPAWCSEPVNSNEFKDPDYKGKNFVLRAIEPAEQTASNVSFGAYRLTDGIVARISGEEPAYPSLTDAQKKQLLTNVTDSTVMVTVSGDQVYIGADPSNPRIGDVRITFTQVTSPKTVSLLQKVVNGTFENYIAKNGKQFSKVEMGTVSAENMIENQKSANKTILWLFRILGIILVIAGNKSLLSFLSTAFAIVPFFQRIIGTGVGIVATVLGLIWSAIVIAVAWMAHRPLIAIALLVVAAALIGWLVSRAFKKKTADVVAILMLVLALGMGAGCTGTQQAKQAQGGDVQVASTDFKGPVKAITVTEFYGEGYPYTVRYEYDTKGRLVSEKEEPFEDGDEEGILEDLCEKDAQGRYTKQVWGSDGEVYSYQICQYDDNGNVTFSEHHQADGSVTSTTWNTYDKAGRLISSSSQWSYGTSSYTNEYDEKGNLVKTTSTTDGKPSYITTYGYDDQGRQIMSHGQNLNNGFESWQYYSFDKNGEQNGLTSVLKDEEGTRINHRDTTFVDLEGLKHNRTYDNYDTPKTYESTFNEQGFVTHYEYFEGSAAHPTMVMDLDYYPDGTTLREVTWKDLVLGQVSNTRTKSFEQQEDTFGNWTRRTKGIAFNFDPIAMAFDSFDNETLGTVYRKIEYRGDDQGQNYGFTGRAGEADIRLTFSFDNDILCGDVTIDGNSWRAVGYRDKEDNSLFVVALKENGDIPWSMFIPGEGDTRQGSLFKDGDEDIAATFTPTREGLKTYSFATTPDEIVGLYQFAFGGDMPSGKLDVSRCGNNWEDIHFDVFRSGARGTLNFAADNFTDTFSDKTLYYRYHWDEDTDTSFSYEISFFDNFAVIRTIEWDDYGLAGPKPTVQGIYAKMPSVG